MGKVGIRAFCEFVRGGGLWRQRMVWIDIARVLRDSQCRGACPRRVRA